MILTILGLALSTGLSEAPDPRTFELTVEVSVIPAPPQRQHKAARLRPIEIVELEEGTGFTCEPMQTDEDGRLTCILQCPVGKSTVSDVVLRFSEQPRYEPPSGFEEIRFASAPTTSLILDYGACEVRVAGSREIERGPDQRSGMLRLSYAPVSTYSYYMAQVARALSGPGTTQVSWSGDVDRLPANIFVGQVTLRARSAPVIYADTADALAELNYLARLTGDDALAEWSRVAYFAVTNEINSGHAETLGVPIESRFDAQTPSGVASDLSSLQTVAQRQIDRGLGPDAAVSLEYLQSVAQLSASLERDPNMGRAFRSDVRASLLQQQALAERTSVER